METIGQRLRRVREEQGCSADTLASAVGVSPRAIEEFESGDLRPDFTLGVLIAQRLGVDPAELALGNGATTSAKDVALHAMRNMELSVMHLAVRNRVTAPAQ